MARPHKRHFKSLSVLLAAVFLAVIGSVMAFFTSTDETSNKFIGSRFDVFLIENKWDPENARSVIPGDEIDKNPQLVNKERASGYVYLRVTVPCDTQMVDNDNGTPYGAVSGNVPMYKFMVAQGGDPVTYQVDTSFSPKQAVQSHWQLVAIDGDDYTHFDAEAQQYIYVYAYAANGVLTPLNQSEMTEPLFDKIQLWNFNEDFDPTKSHNIRVEGFGIQTDLQDLSPSDIPAIWDILEREGS